MANNDQIQVETELLRNMHVKLGQLCNQMQNQVSSIRSLYGSIEPKSGAEVYVSTEKNIACGEAKEVLAACSKALRECQSNTEQLSESVLEAGNLFEQTEEKLISIFNSIAPESDNEMKTLSELTGKEIPVLAARKKMYSTDVDVLSKKEAMKMLNMIMGNGAVEHEWLWFGYDPQEGLEDIFNVLTGNTSKMTAEQISRAKREFVIASYLRLYKMQGGMLPDNQKQMFLEAISKHFAPGENDGATKGVLDYIIDKSASNFDLTAIQMAVDTYNAYGSYGDMQDFVNSMYTAIHLMPLGKDAISRTNANIIIAELNRLNGDYDGLEQNQAVPESTLEMYNNRKTNDGLILDNQSILKQYAEIIHAMETSI